MKKIISVLLLIGTVMISSSCSILGDIIMTEEKRAEKRTEQIVTILKTKDEKALLALFSDKAIGEISDFQNEKDALFSYIEGNISEWECDVFQSGKRVKDGKRYLRINIGITLKTDICEYGIVLIDYPIDTIDPENQGLYMFEVYKTSYNGEWEPWNTRLRAGIVIVE